ncbi:MAG: nuclear transport factor 2 family protein [Alphaproteobacteria bacterium]|jgi:hypothetical protein|nr:nuclear transport factor 2 family protein [Alphaproteobacteria bacterium]MBT4086014.1 nuclear transport factor 2 family protein [Alphaproteobacteria bacterium]MBT4546564.1 nuclear transport factor 2 family protein [Alphaproteobacteria bacterium]MBT7745957.1 nuclear transport factor 2 family protein [Alphaproteobacteria bacterium]
MNTEKTSVSASDTVKEFLSTMEARDLEGAARYLAPGFTMTFPGDAVFSQLSELITWSKDRYQSVGKKYDRFDECPTPSGAIVYCYGSLYGVWLDGSTFEGIRFIDRFTVEDGKFIDQKVWNDMAEVRQSL